MVSSSDSYRKRWLVFVWTYVGFVGWNALTTWWIWHASPAGSVAAIMLNALFMAVVWLLFHITRQQLGNAMGYFSLPLYWLAFEFLHLRWELAWPWLMLGNGFAKAPWLVQWYEITGTMGGTFWVLMSNILIHRFIWRLRTERLEGVVTTWRWSALKIALLIAIPAMWSLWRFSSYTSSTRTAEVVVVQPNVDPYNVKFSKKPMELVQELLSLSESQLTPETEWLVWPETAIPGGMDVNNLDSFHQVKAIKALLDNYPGLTLVTGIDGYEVYDREQPTATARWSNHWEFWFDSYNTAIRVGGGLPPGYYHKSKLVPGVERMPYPHLFRFLERYTIDLGGISGSLGLQKERTVFFNGDSTGVAPVICFESVFGDYVATYIRNGAQAIFIITNDGWWSDTDGYKQHLAYASLRAIETRRSIARSANTGISCFVDERGIIRMKTDWWVEAVIRDTITLNDRTTTYVRYGDVLGRLAVLLGALMLLYTLVSSRTKGFYFRRSKIR